MPNIWGKVRKMEKNVSRETLNHAGNPLIDFFDILLIL